MAAELLAPAGSFEALRAAVQNGADAVYLGYGDFNARRNAKNFTEEEFRAAVAYCHAREVRVYLTLNTLLFDRELAAAAKVVALADEIGVDALLVQDLGVLQMVRAVAPDLPVHASTQMTVHNTDGALAAKALGLSRVVLAREMTREQIAAVCAIEGLETEIFVHGAHCMSYSGQCAMSALIGGRSGNRGTCAQPCRLPYTLGTSRNPYPLSLKDMSLADHVPELLDMGVACFKLEGRMKRPEYVAVVTRIYAALLREGRTATAAERLELAAAFSRGGFTDGYYAGRSGAQMFGMRRENTPEPKQLFDAARESYENKEQFHAGVQMELTIRRGEESRLTVLDFAGNRADVTGPVPEEARSRPLDAEELKDRLKKTGGTIFTAERIQVHLDEGLSLPASAVNALRRDALDGLLQRRCAPPKRRTGAYAPRPKEHDGESTPRLTVSVEDPAQITEELLALSPARVYFPIEKLGALDLALCRSVELCAVLPRIYKEEERAKLRSMLRHAADAGVKCAALSNLGHFALAADCGLTLCGDWSLNVTNSETLRFLKDAELASACVSFELRMEQIRDLDKVLPTEAIVYGRLPLMITENCLNRDGRGQCRCSEGNAMLKDRTGAEFPVLPVFGCRSEIENCVPLFLADKPDYRALGLAYARLRFTTESPAECAKILRRYLSAEDWKPKNFTRGLLYRGVE